MNEGSGEKYTGVAMALHWLIAIAVIVSWRIAEAGEHAATPEAKSEIMGNHFALGVLIFAVVAVRFIWRLNNKPPAPNPNHAGWERTLAKVTHFLIYALLLIMPMVGWFAMSKYGAPISIWGILEVPPLPVAPDPEVAKAIFEQHGTAGKVLLIIIAIHILGALKHTVLDKDGTIFRMLPFGKS